MTSWFFIEMAAKSALIASLALLAATMLRHRAAADRAMVLRIGVILVLALPVIALALPSLQIEAFAASAAAATPAAIAPEELDRLLAAAGPEAAPSIWDDPAPLLLMVWAAGAIVVGLRLLAGLLTLRRWTRSAAPVTDPVWLNAFERARNGAGASERLRLMVGDDVPGPLGWGLRRPVILIDVDTYAERNEADAILAHEVAHVVRGDWPALIATRFVTALFWCNPLVWALAREAVQQAEEAADAYAVHVVEPTAYAETLLSWARIGRGIGVPANSIAPGARALTRRVRAVLEPGLRERAAGSRIAKVAVLLCVGVAAPLAALELVEAARPGVAERSSAVRFGQPATPPVPVVPMARGAPVAPVAPGAAPVPSAAPAPRAELDDGLEVLDDVPRLVEEAVASIDRAELARDVEEAHRIAYAEQVRHMRRGPVAPPIPPMPPVPHIDVEQISAQVRAALPDPQALRAQIRASLAHSRRGMIAGADGMERGAAHMEAQARRFRDRSERERIIVRERARGQMVTHEQLLEAANGMEEGARGMREGARAMRHAPDDVDG